MPTTNFNTCVDQSKILLMFTIIDIFKFCIIDKIYIFLNLNFPNILLIDKVKLTFIKLRSQKSLDTARATL